MYSCALYTVNSVHVAATCIMQYGHVHTEKWAIYMHAKFGSYYQLLKKTYRLIPISIIIYT